MSSAVDIHTERLFLCLKELFELGLCLCARRSEACGARLAQPVIECESSEEPSPRISLEVIPHPEREDRVHCRVEYEPCSLEVFSLSCAGAAKRDGEKACAEDERAVLCVQRLLSECAVDESVVVENFSAAHAECVAISLDGDANLDVRPRPLPARNQASILSQSGIEFDMTREQTLPVVITELLKFLRALAVHWGGAVAFRLKVFEDTLFDSSTTSLSHTHSSALTNRDFLRNRVLQEGINVLLPSLSCVHVVSHCSSSGPHGMLIYLAFLRQPAHLHALSTAEGMSSFTSLSEPTNSRTGSSVSGGLPVHLLRFVNGLPMAIVSAEDSLACQLVKSIRAFDWERVSLQFSLRDEQQSGSNGSAERMFWLSSSLGPARSIEGKAMSSLSSSASSNSLAAARGWKVLLGVHVHCPTVSFSSARREAVRQLPKSVPEQLNKELMQLARKFAQSSFFEQFFRSPISEKKCLQEQASHSIAGSLVKMITFSSNDQFREWCVQKFVSPSVLASLAENGATEERVKEAMKGNLQQRILEALNKKESGEKQAEKG